MLVASAWLVAGCSDAGKTTEARFGFSITAVSSVQVRNGTTLAMGLPAPVLAPPRP